MAFGNNHPTQSPLHLFDFFELRTEKSKVWFDLPTMFAHVPDWKYCCMFEAFKNKISVCIERLVPNWAQSHLRKKLVQLPIDINIFVTLPESMAVELSYILIFVDSSCYSTSFSLDSRVMDDLKSIVFQKFSILQFLVTFRLSL